MAIINKQPMKGLKVKAAPMKAIKVKQPMKRRAPVKVAAMKDIKAKTAAPVQADRPFVVGELQLKQGKLMCSLYVEVDPASASGKAWFNGKEIGQADMKGNKAKTAAPVKAAMKAKEAKTAAPIRAAMKADEANAAAPVFKYNGRFYVSMFVEVAIDGSSLKMFGQGRELCVKALKDLRPFYYGGSWPWAKRP